MPSHPSGLPGAFDRGPDALDRAALVFLMETFMAPSEFNELQTLLLHKLKRIGNLVAADGDRRAGGEIIVDLNDPATTATVTLTAGEIYIGGMVLPVTERVFNDIPMTGDVSFGVRVVSEYVTHEDDVSLLGIETGTAAFGEPGAAREIRTLTWSLSDAAEAGTFAQVYLMRNGAVISQGPPPALTGVQQQISGYDFDSNGHYIVDGCQVRSLGQVGNDQIFSLGAGTANILGWKRTRTSALRLEIPEEPDLEEIALETHTFLDSGDGSMTVAVDRPPISAITAANVTKQITQNITRGASPDGLDALGHSSVQEIVHVEQGGTPFDPAEYTLDGNSISWAPGGNEPAQASSYAVTYNYYAAVTPDAVTDTAVTLSSDAVDGKPLTLSYSSKIPRKDVIGIDQSGAAVYVKGVSARSRGVAPKPPTDVLKVAEVHNDWIDKPVVLNNGTAAYTYDVQRRYFEVFESMLQQFNRSTLQQDVQARDTVDKDGIFTDQFRDNFYRDAGYPQTAAVNRGVLQLPVAVVGQASVGDRHILDYDEEIVIHQRLQSRPMKINPYANFRTMPGALSLNPPTDVWTEHITEFTSAVTQEILVSANTPTGTTSFNEEVSETVSDAEVMRQIDINFTLEGFAANEELALLSFAGVDITPDPALVADLNGEIVGTFTIPELVPTGSQPVRAEGSADSFAETIFVAQGTIETELMRTVTLISRNAPQPVVNNIVQIVQGGGNQGGGGNDPLAETFTLTQGRQIAGVNLKVAAIGDPNNGIRVQLAATLNGVPTNEVFAEAFLPMQGVAGDDVLQFRWPLPVYLPPNREFCFVALTDDADHSLYVAQQGDVDTNSGQLISSQPYDVGVLFASSNRTAWEVLNDADIWFELVAASYTETSRTIDLWTGTLPAFTDVQIRATVEVPTANASFRFELVRDDGSVIALAPEQPFAFDELVDEPVTLRAVLSGTEIESPVLYPGTRLIAGLLSNSAEYVTREFPIKGVLDAQAIFAQWLPAGASITVEMDKSDDIWVPLSVVKTLDRGGGWTEPVYEVAPHDATTGGRVRVTLNGAPGARPAIAELRAFGK
ncbi:CheY-specific phosphatase CheX [Labrenzia sp. EL_126]|nr:CheY-specific phosphatase CheX [Labrenzia sp. EL_126]